MRYDARMPAVGDHWRIAMEHSPVGMAIVATDGTFVAANQTLCDMLGYDADAMATLTFQQLTYPEDLAADVHLAEQCMAGEIESYRITKRYMRADGSTLVADLSVVMMRDENGVPTHFISQIADLSERYAFSERLSLVEAQVDAVQRISHAIVDGVPAGLLQIDPVGRYLVANNRMQDFIDLAFPDGHDGLAGQPGEIYTADQSRKLTPDELPSTRAHRGEEFDGVRVWAGRDPGSRRAMSVSARRITDRDGRSAGAVLAYHDITDILHANQVKDEFVSAVSHELRTPLAAALAYLELLEDSSDVTEDGQQYVTAARRNMVRLSHLIADLLYATRTASGAPPIDHYEFDFVTVVTESVEAAAISAGGAGVVVEVDIPDTLPMRADGLRLRQMVDNLVANAIAFSARGDTVRVTVTEAGGTVSLTVADSGTGIDPGEMSQVFERFFRGTNARAKHVPGTGLGLTIVRSVVEAHSGEVHIDSEPDRGTTVSVTLPRSG